MALAYVQGGVNHKYSGTSLAIAFASNVTAGNLIAVVVFWSDITNTVTVADGLGNTYIAVDNPINMSTSSRVATFYAKNITGGACTVTVTTSGSNQTAAAVHEISGADTSAPLDQHSVTYLGWTGTGTDAVTASVTTTTDGEYIFGAAVPTSGAASSSGTGYTDRLTAGFLALHTEDKIQSSAGAIAVTFTNSVTQNSGVAIMTFKGQSGSTGKPYYAYAQQ